MDIEKEIRTLGGRMDGLQSELSATNKMLSTMTSALEKLIRIEERQINQKNDVDGFGKRLEGYDKRQRDVELKLGISSEKGQTVYRWFERIAWVIILAAISSIGFFKEK